MWVMYDDMEIVKVSNMMVDGDLRYTVYCMGEELWTVSPMTWYGKVMSEQKKMQEKFYFFYKMHEQYFIEAQSWEEEDWMNFIQYLGNWDYLAQKVHDMEAAFIQSEMDKCMVSVDAAHEEYGVWLAPKGKECVLKKWDEMVQFCEWADMNGVDKWEYKMWEAKMMWEAKHAEMGNEMMACEAKEEEADEDEDMDNEMMDMTDNMPMFVYQERSVEEMEQAIQMACYGFWNHTMMQHAEMGSCMIDGYVMYRDAAVMQTQAVINKISDRPAAEALVEHEIERMMAMADDRWSCEFDSYHMYYMNAMEIQQRAEDCAAHTDLYWYWEGMPEPDM